MSANIERAAEVIRVVDNVPFVGPKQRKRAQALADADPPLLVTDEMQAVLDIAAQLTGKAPWTIDQYGRNMEVGTVALAKAVDAHFARRGES